MPPEPYFYIPGALPLLISAPHAGDEIPDSIAHHMTETGRSSQDTDWQVDRLYTSASTLGAHRLTARYSRYVIDLNRAPDNAPLYPGRFESGLCPTQSFGLAPLYQPGHEPTETQIHSRLTQYWHPYHQRIQSLLALMREQHGYAILLEAHSVAPTMPSLFEGRIPDFNWGNADGRTCAPSLLSACTKASLSENHTQAINGRFKGGHITRHYGNPTQNIHAIQLELSQATYWNPDTQSLDPTLLHSLSPILNRILHTLIDWRP